MCLSCFWVENVFMKLSEISHQRLEIFFREHFADENLKLPQIRIFARRGADLFTKVLAVEGITFERFIFINPRNLRRGKDGRWQISRELIAHEAAHTLQYRREGILRFFYNYLKEYYAGLRRQKRRDNIARMRAYLDIPHEVEARLVAAKFVRWSRSFQ